MGEFAFFPQECEGGGLGRPCDSWTQVLAFCLLQETDGPWFGFGVLF